jgi:hypothetical protein
MGANATRRVAQRKNRAMWRNWNVRDGLALHTLQLAILRRGLELLDTGGRLVYSTCSLNVGWQPPPVPPLPFAQHSSRQLRLSRLSRRGCLLN